MAPRLELQALLTSLLGSSNVYFQPPESIKMKYPAIVYTLDFQQTTFADDKPYTHRPRYLVTVIDANPDSLIPAKIAALPLCVFDRFFTADKLNHTAYRLFF